MKCHIQWNYKQKNEPVKLLRSYYSQASLNDGDMF